MVVHHPETSPTYAEIHSNIDTNLHTWSHICCTHSHIPEQTHTITHIYRPICTWRFTYKYTLTSHIHSHINIHVLACTHTHTFTHSPVIPCLGALPRPQRRVWSPESYISSLRVRRTFEPHGSHIQPPLVPGAMLSHRKQLSPVSVGPEGWGEAGPRG